MASHQDSAWKDILDARFEAFIEFFWPEIHRDVDWGAGVEFLDKELEPILRDSPSRERLADKLVKVRFKNGSQALILIHVEVQGSPEALFARRMFQYYYRILERYRLEVVSLAVLTDSRPSFRPDRHECRRWGFELRFRFPVVKLLDYEGRRAELESSWNPFAMVVLAHLEARGAKNDFRRSEVKWRLARRLYERGYRKADIMVVYKFIDWILRLPLPMECKLQDQVRTLEGKKTMPYVTHIEEIAEARGREEELRDAIAFGLKLRFGPKGVALLPRLGKVRALKRLRALLAALYREEPITGIRERLRSR